MKNDFLKKSHNQRQDIGVIKQILFDFVLRDRHVFSTITAETVNTLKNFLKSEYYYFFIIISHFRSKSNPERLEVVTSLKAVSNPVKKFSQKNGITVHDWNIIKKDENLPNLREFDLGIVVSFGHLIPEAVIDSFKL